MSSDAGCATTTSPTRFVPSSSVIVMRFSTLTSESARLAGPPQSFFAPRRSRRRQGLPSGTLNGGGTTHGVRTLNLARDVESQGAMGVVLNSPISDLNLLAVSRVVDIPVIITVTKEDTNIQSRIDSGASILNVACSTDTPRVVAKIREQFPDVPIIASGGKTGESISATIAAGANAITYTPPSPAVLFKEMMEKYRE